MSMSSSAMRRAPWADWLDERRRRAKRAAVLAGAMAGTKAFLAPDPRKARARAKARARRADAIARERTRHPEPHRPGAPKRPAVHGRQVRPGGPPPLRPVGSNGRGPKPPKPNRRIGLLTVGLLLLVVVVAGRLTQIQGLDREKLLALGKRQRTHDVTIPARRGAIFDRNGTELALTVDQTSVWVDPRNIAPGDVDAEATALAPILGMDVEVVRQRMLSPGKKFVYLARRIPDATADQVKKIVADRNLTGVYFVDEPMRFYPAGDLASSVLGHMTADDLPAGGLETKYKDELAGSSGEYSLERDGNKVPIAGTLEMTKAAVPGQDLILTLDRSLQYEVEKDLGDEIIASGSKGGMAVVMQVDTGDILAMVNLVAGPNAGDRPVNAPSNQVVTNVYEPGSVNKLITVAAALDDGVISPSKSYTVDDKITIGTKDFHEHDLHGRQQMSVTDILSVSSNVGTIEIARDLGRDRLKQALSRFGLGHTTALQFPGESAGIMPAWSGSDMGAVPIGQGLSVTAMQMIAAYNAIANGGMYVAPRLVKATVDANGHQTPAPESDSARVVSPATAKAITPMLANVVRSGTAPLAAINGYTVAGKTGTARKPRTDGVRGYIPGAYMSSFAGFVPAEHPAVTAMVILDQPTPIYGGLVAAPVFSRIASYALRQFKVPPPTPDQVAAAGIDAALARSVTSASSATTSSGSPAPLRDGDVPQGAQGAATIPSTPTTKP